MEIQIKTDRYNHRRFGKPYIAKVDFSNPKGDATWGDWIGHHGDAGVLVLDAEPGDIVMSGQKDFRARRPVPPTYHQVQEDGTLKELPDRAAAYQAWQDAKGGVA